MQHHVDNMKHYGLLYFICEAEMLLVVKGVPRSQNERMNWNCPRPALNYTQKCLPFYNYKFLSWGKWDTVCVIYLSGQVITLCMKPPPPLSDATHPIVSLMQYEMCETFPVADFQTPA